ncbi:Hypothetical protein D9617_3g020690 [Elsinoe fawcettii]|nr:Hypothetical protein D9617_3g020690 [Elsinoe fawcettii]
MSSGYGLAGEQKTSLSPPDPHKSRDTTILKPSDTPVYSTNTSPQAARTAALQAAYRRAEAQGDRSSAKNAGEIRSLGLLDASDEEKHIKKPSLLPSKSTNL